MNTCTWRWNEAWMYLVFFNDNSVREEPINIYDCSVSWPYKNQLFVGYCFFFLILILIFLKYNVVSTNAVRSVFTLKIHFSLFRSVSKFKFSLRTHLKFIVQGHKSTIHGENSNLPCGITSFNCWLIICFH